MGHALVLIEENSKCHHEHFWYHDNHAPRICAAWVIIIM
jgi:hypothetical protein